MEEEGLKFYRCNTCGNLLLTLIDPNVTPVCCGRGMEIVTANQYAEGAEKHVPIIEVRGNVTTVKVGMQPHPMSTEHSIEWIALTNGSRIEMQKLGPAASPEAVFTDMDLDGGKYKAYSFCNIHGLWSSEK